MRLSSAPLLLLASCVMPTLPTTGIGPGRVDRRLILGDPPGPTVTLEADWRVDGGRYCVSQGRVDVITPAGTFALEEANLCATRQPPALEGDARVPFPVIGFLASFGVSGTAPQGHVTLGRGQSQLTLGKESITAEPTHFYLTVDYGSRYDVTFSRGSLAIPDRMIIDPHAPTFYVNGDLAGLLPANLRGVVLGFSPSGGLPYVSAQNLYDGTTFAPRKLDGHLLVQGSIPLGDLPLSMTGRFVADIAGQPTVLAGDVGLKVGYAAAGFNLSLDLAQASVVYTQGGTFQFAATVSPALIRGTPLSAFEPGANGLTLYGLYRSAADYVLLVRGDARLIGIPLRNAELGLEPGGARMAGRAELAGLGPVDLAGQFKGDGSFSLKGHADLTAAGFPVTGVTVELGPNGVKLAGRVTIAGLGPIDLAGSTSADGSFSLRGRGDLAAAGLPLTGAEVVLSTAGMQLGATVRFGGTPFKVTGTVQPTGALALSGAAPIKAGPITGRAQLTLDGRGARASFQGRVCAGPSCVDVAEVEVDSQGKVCPAFPVVGKQCVKVL